MNSFRLHEVLVGAVAVVLVAELIIAAYIGGGGGDDRGGYEVLAAFSGVEGLAEGSDVRLSGVVVGEVAALWLDENLRPVAVLEIDEGIPLPEDTDAAIRTDGLLGDKYVALEPGGAEAFLEPGDRIAFTQPAVVLEDVLELIVAQGRAVRGESRDAQ